MYARDFDAGHSNFKDKTLSILMKEDRMYYAIIDSDNVMVAHTSIYESYFDSNRQGLMYEQLLLPSMPKVAICIMGKRYFHLPKVMPEIGDHILDLKHQNLYVDKMMGNEVFTHFGLTKSQNEFVQNLYKDKNCVIHHFSNVLANYYCFQNTPVLHVHVEENELHIYVAKDGIFLGYRQLDVGSVEDILYFILAFYQEFELDPSKDLLTLSGWLDSNSALFTKIYGFIAKIYWVEDSIFGLPSGIPDNLKDHYYFAHFANSLCVSSVEV
jgi:hypothetical protein